MPLSWNEIRHRAIQFSRDWRDESRERAEAKTFWDQFFQVFGIPRRTVAAFEEPVRGIGGTYGYIDLFWRGMLLVEHKSRGADLGKAESQAFRYLQDLVNSGRMAEMPRYVIISDFAKIALHDLEPDEQLDLPLFDQWRVKTTEFPLEEFHRHIHEFAFIPGYKQHRFLDQDPINLKAVAIMGDLHDALEAGGYAGHELERMLVRVLFCLFAEDSAIFERDIFTQYLENRTSPDGSDLGSRLARLFEVLNTPRERRQANLDEDLAVFPYVNGALFAERLGFADFNRAMRDALVAATRFDWSQISPAVFGALFQSIMEPRERRQIGAHYTSERDILKVARSLFLDDLRAEFEKTRKNGSKALSRFHDKLATLRFLDPACGCGNFLVITYRELRILELDLLKAMHDTGEQELDISLLSRLDVDQFYGIEIEEWPARIAEVALWLMDHQMNQRLSLEFGQYFVRLPLRKAPHIHCANALLLDWNTVIPASQCSFILGNPPFVGAKFMGPAQRMDLASVARDAKNHGLLDYVTGWYFKAADYIKNGNLAIRAAFVSTNSITQGEQAGILWNPLLVKYGLKIHFGHRTFPWQSEARGKAHVHVVIIGFGIGAGRNNRIYEYHTDTEDPTIQEVDNISPYLVEGPDLAVANRSVPLCDVPHIGIGNKPIDGGNYLFTPEEKHEFLKLEPTAKPYFRRWIGSDEFINGIERWCLWLGDCPPDELRRMPHAVDRIHAVSQFRKESKSPPTQKLAATPTRFHVENMPKSRYLVIPEVSSERRHYIPIGFMASSVLASNLVKIVPSATLYHFGILSSAMHMAWMRQVCGRLESRYRYSARLVYNNFPWPQHPTPKQSAAVETAAQEVLDIRAAFADSTLADLYDPLTMPPALVKAHAALDRAVDRCYRSHPFPGERQRVEYLFQLYQQLVAPLLAEAEGKGKRKSCHEEC